MANMDKIYEEDLQYVILRDSPSENNNGQYVFELLNSQNQFPGRYPNEVDRDLFTFQEDIHTPSTYKIRKDIGHPIHSRNLYLSNVTMHIDRHKYSNIFTQISFTISTL